MELYFNQASGFLVRIDSDRKEVQGPPQRPVSQLPTSTHYHSGPQIQITNITLSVDLEWYWNLWIETNMPPCQ